MVFILISDFKAIKLKVLPIFSKIKNFIESKKIEGAVHFHQGILRGSHPLLLVNEIIFNGARVYQAFPRLEVETSSEY